jgi:hypothetical protein
MNRERALPARGRRTEFISDIDEFRRAAGWTKVYLERSPTLLPGRVVVA